MKIFRIFNQSNQSYEHRNGIPDLLSILPLLMKLNEFYANWLQNRTVLQQVLQNRDIKFAA